MTANALNAGYVLTPLTKSGGGLLRIVVALTRFTAVTALDRADTAIRAAASPELFGESAVTARRTR